MIPVIEREVVTKNKWLENDEFLDVIALAQSSLDLLQLIQVFT